MTTRKIFSSSLALAGVCLATLVSAQTETPGANPNTADAKMGPFEVVGHYSPYEYPQSIGEGQAFHIVVRGDTLWDLADRYLGNPFLWPQIWEANGYITKARLIYPGDPILLPSVQTAEASEPEEATVAQPQEVAVMTPLSEPAKVQEWEDMDALVSIVSPDMVRSAGYISASIEDESLKIKGMETEGGTPVERFTAGPRDYVYLDRGANSGVKAGDLYTVNRRTRVIKHPSSGKKVGHRIDTTGVARVLVAGETSSRAVIEKAWREIEVGDYLRPLTEIQAPLVKRRVVVEGGDLSIDGSRSPGSVIDIDFDSPAAGTGSIIGIDMGSGAGLAVGKVFTLYRQADRANSLTWRPLGSAVAITVGDKFSIARIVYSRAEVVVGDRVVLQP